MNWNPAAEKVLPASRTRGSRRACGLYFYGYRFYDPVTGRWPSRDPIEEAGGDNLYGFVSNRSVAAIDFLGMSVWAIVVPSAGEISKGKIFAGTNSDLNLKYAEEQIKERIRLAAAEKQIVNGMTDDYWNEKVKRVIVNYKGEKYTHEGLSRADFIKWLEFEEKSAVKALLNGKESELKELSESFGKGPGYEYSYHQKIVGQHSFGGYPGGSGKDADEVLEGYDFSTCGITSEGIRIEGLRTKWKFHVAPFGHDEEACEITFFPLWVENLYFDKKGRPVDGKGKPINKKQ